MPDKNMDASDALSHDNNYWAHILRKNFPQQSIPGAIFGKKVYVNMVKSVRLGDLLLSFITNGRKIIIFITRNYFLANFTTCLNKNRYIFFRCTYFYAQIDNFAVSEIILLMLIQMRLFALCQ